MDDRHPLRMLNRHSPDTRDHCATTVYSAHHYLEKAGPLGCGGSGEGYGKAAEGAMPLALQGFSIIRMIFYTAPLTGTRGCVIF